MRDYVRTKQARAQLGLLVLIILNLVFWGPFLYTALFFCTSAVIYAMSERPGE